MGLLLRLLGVQAQTGGSLPTKADPLRGWTNLGQYEIHGTNPKTGRSNKKTCLSLSDETAKEWALSAGLIEPIQVKELPRFRPSGSQEKRLKSCGYKGDINLLTNVDASAIISYTEDGDRRKITASEWKNACNAGYEISALSGPSLYRTIMKYGDWRCHIED